MHPQPQPLPGQWAPQAHAQRQPPRAWASQTFAGVQVVSTMWQVQLAEAAVFKKVFMVSWCLFVPTGQNSAVGCRYALHPDGSLLHPPPVRCASWTGPIGEIPPHA